MFLVGNKHPKLDPNSSYAISTNHEGPWIHHQKTTWKLGSYPHELLERFFTIFRSKFPLFYPKSQLVNVQSIFPAALATSTKYW